MSEEIDERSYSRYWRWGAPPQLSAPLWGSDGAWTRTRVEAAVREDLDGGRRWFKLAGKPAGTPSSGGGCLCGQCGISASVCVYVYCSERVSDGGGRSSS